MSRTDEQLNGVTSLGNQNTKYEYQGANTDLLETFVNKHADLEYIVEFKCPEFTSLCPKTGQPDFATIYIRYIPNEKMVESKSLKLYLGSFRNHGDFHEDCVCQIMKDLTKLMEPKWLRVIGDFTPRGGISITPVAEYCQKDYQPPSYMSQLPDELHTRHKT